MRKRLSANAHSDTLQPLGQVVRLIASTRNPAVALERTLQLVGEGLGAYGGAVVLLQDEARRPQGYRWGEYQQQLVEVGEELLSGSEAQGSALARRATLSGPSGAPGRDGMLLAAPVHGLQQTLGVLVFLAPLQSSAGLETALTCVNAVGTCLGLYLQTVGLQERLKGLAEARAAMPPAAMPLYDPDHIVGESAPLKAVLQEIELAARSRSTTLLRGESGTGKELVARALHQRSERRQQPFVRLNCAALPEALLESELFGHERGAFTGAVKMRRGRFEVADKGTLFLDEIGDISLATQAKLLRVLQERTFERVGGTRSISVDVRIIAATNVNLEEAVRAGRFREDLYYRLNVVPIVLPPLRERKGDIPLLVGHFLARFNAENNKRLKISSAAMDLIVGYEWPGNVRELENCVERMVVMARREVIAPEDVPLPLTLHQRPALPARGAQTPAEPGSLPRTIADLERQRLLEALRQSGGVQTRAATLLGITPRQLGYRLKKYGLEPRGRFR